MDGSGDGDVHFGDCVVEYRLMREQAEVEALLKRLREIADKIIADKNANSNLGTIDELRCLRRQIGMLEWVLGA